MIWKELIYKDKKIKFLSQSLNGKTWIHVNGETLVIESDKKGPGRKKIAAGAAMESICAPMPGKITKIFVASGNEVKKGDAVIVMEAMKMEYTLKADQDTIIEAVLVEVGSQVSLGEMLVKFQDVSNG